MYLLHPDRGNAHPARQEPASELRAEAVLFVERGPRLRTSSYTIYVDLPGQKGEVLLVHGYTGAYDKVSRRVASYLRALGGKKPCLPDGVEPPGEPTIAVLRRRGYLTEKTHEEEVTVFDKVAKAFSEGAARTQPSYVFMPTYSCNLRCPYCFQDYMRTDPSSTRLLRTMEPETVDRIFAALPAIEQKHGLNGERNRSRHYLFFGGEPFLARSRAVVEYIFDKARSLSAASFSAITNGTQLQAYADLLGPEKISLLQITLDGPPAEHDRRRVHTDGSGSFEKIAANVTMALDRGVQVKVRLNVDRNNVDLLPAVAEEVVARGWNVKDGFSAYVSPIHPSNDKVDGESLMDSWVLSQRVDELRREHPAMAAIGYTDETLRDRLLGLFTQQRDPMPRFRPAACGAHTNSYIFDAFGDVYVCWERLAGTEERIGRVSEQGEFVANEEVEQLWRSRTVSSNVACRRCRYAFYCGGGCASIAMRVNGEFHSNYCDGFPRRFRAAAAAAYADFTEGKRPRGVDDAGCDR